MPQHIACLSFDFDALSSWIYRDQNTPTALSRGEFGVVGAERILELLERRGVKATWFIPGHTIETYPDACARVHAAGHEVGHHGYLHEPPAELSREHELAVLRRGNRLIAELTGSRAKGYRSPSWDLSPNTVELLVAEGFRYDSSLMGHDHQPYRARLKDAVTREGPPGWGALTELVEVPISWSLDDYPHFEYVRRQGFLQQGLSPAGGVLENFVDDFRYMTLSTERGILTYTFHPQVIGRGHRMLMLERLIDQLGELGASFSRMIDAVEEYERWQG